MFSTQLSCIGTNKASTLICFSQGLSFHAKSWNIWTLRGWVLGVNVYNHWEKSLQLKDRPTRQQIGSIGKNNYISICSVRKTSGWTWSAEEEFVTAIFGRPETGRQEKPNIGGGKTVEETKIAHWIAWQQYSSSLLLQICSCHFAKLSRETKIGRGRPSSSWWENLAVSKWK